MGGSTSTIEVVVTPPDGSSASTRRIMRRNHRPESLETQPSMAGRPRTAGADVPEADNPVPALPPLTP
jgi:hypothetical protein